MAIDILMPALSPTMEKGTLAKWLKKEGDAIKSGDVLAEIETDKATMEVEAVDEGVLAKIVVPAGSADVPVNQVIGLIAEDGEDVSAASASRATPAPPATPPSGPQAQPAAAPEPTAMKPANGMAQADDQILEYGRPGATPGAPMTTGTSEAFASRPDDGHGAAGAGGQAAPQHGGSRVIASPLARRIARQAGLDLATIAGSGPNGRIVERDVNAAKAAPKQAASPPPAAAPAAPQPAATPMMAVSGKDPDVRNASAPTAPDSVIKAMFADGTYEEVPHDSMRRTIARRLTEAKGTIPHFYLNLDCEIDGLLALREQINASAGKDKDGKPAFKVSVNDFVIKALALALQQVPEANVTWTEGGMLRHRHSDVGTAVLIPGGLVTPLVRRAETKTLSAISNEMKSLAARAKVRRLKPDEYTGGSSAVSNLGMFGIKDFCAVINPPHSSIIAVGAGEQRVVVRNGQMAIATIMSTTISCDHRAMDGALGAQLFAAFKQFIEKPMSMLA